MLFGEEEGGAGGGGAAAAGEGGLVDSAAGEWAAPSDGSGPGDDFFDEADVTGSPLGAEDEYSVFGRATMKAQSAALVQVRRGERRTGGGGSHVPPLKTRGPLRGALRVSRPALEPASLNRPRRD